MGNDEYETRKCKVEKIKNGNKIPYASKFVKTIDLNGANELNDNDNVSICGRIVSIRKFGSFTFITLYDINGTMQVSVSINELGDNYKELIKIIDNGDFIGITGDIYTTNTGQKTVKATYVELLSKTLRPLPEKYHSINNSEIKTRQRYLDIISNEDSRNTFKKRIEIIKFIRNYLESNGFEELETPIIQNVACGANAKPFQTHHNALNEDYYLRIAPELYLKTAIAAGFDKVFEIGKNFRNEGIDSSHLQEFTMIEWYAAYWDYLKNIDFTSTLLQDLIGTIKEDLKINYQGINLDFTSFNRLSYSDEMSSYLKKDFLEIHDLEELKSILKDNCIFSNVELENLKSLTAASDYIFKKKIRPYIIQPTIVTDYPYYMVPLARTNDNDSRKLDMFQVIVNSWEIAKSYSELIDPQKQKNEFIKQILAKSNGDEESMNFDKAFLLAMEHGMPPMSGLGMGLDRLIALLTNNKSLRDVVMFPQTKKSNDMEKIINNKK